jgi:hypothetical protein
MCVCDRYVTSTRSRDADESAKRIADAWTASHLGPTATCVCDRYVTSTRSSDADESAKRIAGAWTASACHEYVKALIEQDGMYAVVEALATFDQPVGCQNSVRIAGNPRFAGRTLILAPHTAQSAEPLGRRDFLKRVWLEGLDEFLQGCDPLVVSLETAVTPNPFDTLPRAKTYESFWSVDVAKKLAAGTTLKGTPPRQV